MVAQVYPTDASLGQFLRDPHRFQYQFLICHIGGNNYGERLTFFLAPNGSNIPLDSTGGGLGLVNEKETATSTSANRFVAVEFDTYRNNPWEASLPINHVGVCINSRNSIELIYWPSGISYGIPNEAWIIYNSSTQNLSVIFFGFENSSTIHAKLFSNR